MATPIICPQCGSPRSITENFCGVCGYQFRGFQENHSTVPPRNLQQTPITQVLDTIADTVPVFFPQQKNKRRTIVFISLAILLIMAVFIGIQVGKSISATVNNSPNSSPQVGSGGSTVISPTRTPTATPTATATPTPTPSPTPVPQPGTILYQENVSNNWQDWAPNGGWTALNGKLLNNGQGTPPLIAPYDPGSNNIADYAVETKITRIRYTSSVESSFGLVARSTADGGGYTFSICAVVYYAFGSSSGCNGKEIHEALLLIGQNFPDGGTVLGNQAFQPPINTEYTYRIEVKGNTITGFINGKQIIGPVTDNTYLSSGGQVSVWSSNCQLSISSFEIIAL